VDIRRAKAILTPYMPPGPVTREAVKAAFAAAVRASHPDTLILKRDLEEAGGVVNGHKAYAMEDLQGARNRWLQHIGEAPPRAEPACPYCRGTGIMSVQMRRVPCIKGCDPD